MSYAQQNPKKAKFVRPRAMLLSEEPEHEQNAVRQLELLGYEVTLVPLVCSGVVHRFYDEEGNRDHALIAHHINTSTPLSPFFKPLLECTHAVHDEASLHKALTELRPDLVIAPETLAVDALAEGVETLKQSVATYASSAKLVFHPGSSNTAAIMQAAQNAAAGRAL